MRQRHGMGHSSLGFEVGRHLISHLMNPPKGLGWRIGNDIHTCTLCGRCEAVCPVNAITVSVHNRTWTLNNRRCRHCLNCVVKCPAHCLSQVKL